MTPATTMRRRSLAAIRNIRVPWTRAHISASAGSAIAARSSVTDRALVFATWKIPLVATPSEPNRTAESAMKRKPSRPDAGARVNGRSGAGRSGSAAVDGGPAAAREDERHRGGQDEERVLVAARDGDPARRVHHDAGQEEALAKVVEEERGRHDRQLGQRRPPGEEPDDEQDAADRVRRDEIPAERVTHRERVAHAGRVAGDALRADVEPEIAVHEEDHAEGDPEDREPQPREELHRAAADGPRRVLMRVAGRSRTEPGRREGRGRAAPSGGPPPP